MVMVMVMPMPKMVARMVTAVRMRRITRP